MQIGAEHAGSNGIQFVTGSSSMLVVRLTHAIKWPNRLIISSLNAQHKAKGFPVNDSRQAIEREQARQHI